MTYIVNTLAERSDLGEAIDRLSEQSWPRFLLHGDITRWHLLFEMFAGQQLLLTDASSGALLAVGHTAPLVWDGSAADLPISIEDILVRAERAHRDGHAPNTLSALAAMVSPERRGEGLSTAVIREMRGLAARLGCTSLIAPVRPTWKERYPLATMARYVTWTRPDGQVFDPWLRVHFRLGAEGLCVADNTLAVEGSVQAWEEWTGMAFPDSGPYVVPGALQPVVIDRERDVGRYEDPNYWMRHRAA